MKFANLTYVDYNSLNTVLLTSLMEDLRRVSNYSHLLEFILISNTDHGGVFMSDVWLWIHDSDMKWATFLSTIVVQ